MHTTYAQSIFHLSGAGECRLSFMEAMAKTDTRTERRKHTHTHTHTHAHTNTHTWEAGVRHVGHILVVSIMREAQLLNTHR
jgi:hypothetical protein